MKRIEIQVLKDEVLNIYIGTSFDVPGLNIETLTRKELYHEVVLYVKKLLLNEKFIVKFKFLGIINKD